MAKKNISSFYQSMKVNFSAYRSCLPSFKSTERTTYYSQDKGVYTSPKYEARDLPKDGSVKVVNSNITSLFRNDLVWDNIAKKLNEKEFPTADKVNTYIFGCSDGSEAFSFAIALLEQLGYKGAEKYFPIYASDIDPEVIELAQTGKIPVYLNDLCKLDRNIRYGSEWKYYSYRCIDRCDNRNIYELTVDESIKENIIFSRKDILDGLDEVEPTNSLVFCRNFWKYMTPKQMSDRLWKLREKLDESSRVIIGDFDKSSYDVPCFFENIGFRSVSPDSSYMNGNMLKLSSEHKDEFYPSNKTEWQNYVEENHAGYKLDYLY